MISDKRIALVATAVFAIGVLGMAILVWPTQQAQAIGSPIQVWGGGTGWAAIQSGTIPYGNGTSALSTTTAGSNGNILSLSNGIPKWIASTTYANGTGISTAFANNTLTITNSGVISLTNGTNVNCSGTNPGSCSFSGTLPVTSGGTNTTSFPGNVLVGTNSTGNTLVATGTPQLTIGWLNATSSAASSSISYALGIATSSPWAALSVSGNGSILSTENKLATSTSMTLDWRQGNQQLIQTGLSAVTVSFTGYLAGMTLRVPVCNPNGTAGAITFSGVEWAGGAAPTQTTTALQCDIYSFIATNATSTSGGIKVFGAATTGFN